MVVNTSHQRIGWGERLERCRSRPQGWAVVELLRFRCNLQDCSHYLDQGPVVVRSLGSCRVASFSLQEYNHNLDKELVGVGVGGGCLHYTSTSK